MKITKKGNVKLEKGDYRVGNYVFHEENNFIKVCDIAGLISWRISNTMIGSGLLLAKSLELAKNGEEGAIAFLQGYATTIHLVLSTVPDIIPEQGIDYLSELCETSTKCIKRHPELYGLSVEPSDEKNANDLQRVKDMEDIKQEIEEKIN